MKRENKNSTDWFKNLLNGLKDASTFIALLALLFTFWATWRDHIWKKEDNKQAQEQFNEFKKKDSIDFDYYKRQLIRFHTRDSLNDLQFSVQLHEAARRYKIEESNYRHERQYDSLQDKIYTTHQRLSLRPFLNILKYSVDDQPGLYLINLGTGPALITKFEIYYNGQKLSNTTDILKFNSPFYNQQQVSCGYPSYNTGLASNQKIGLFYTKKENVSDFQSFTTLMQQITLHIEYKSLYGEKFKFPPDSGNTLFPTN